MTVSTEVSFATRRADDVRLVAGVSAAHFVSHFYMLVLPPLFAFVRAGQDQRAAVGALLLVVPPAAAFVVLRWAANRTAVRAA